MPLVREVLSEAIEAGGSSLRDHRQADGELGYFQHHWAVYGKEGEKCPRCWNYVEQLHEHEEHAVCPRCLGVLKENHDGR